MGKVAHHLAAAALFNHLHVNAHIPVHSAQELQTHQGLVVITKAGKELICSIK